MWSLWTDARQLDTLRRNASAELVIKAEQPQIIHPLGGRYETVIFDA